MSPPLRLPSRQSDGHKGNYGRCLLVGGSRGMAGSIALSAIAALRTGSGLVTAAVPDACLETVAAFHPCLMTVGLADHDGAFADGAVTELVELLRTDDSAIGNRYDAVGCGPGMGDGPGSVRIVRRLLQRRSLRRVFDADALNVMAAHRLWEDCEPDGGDTSVVLTPHPGELQRLTSVSPSDREGQIAAAQELAGKTGFVIVVKGGPSVVVDGEHRHENDTGNPGMATAGSGDVLTGVITSLLGQPGPNGSPLSVFDAARLGVWVHGAAGDAVAERLGQPGMMATDLIDRISSSLSEVVDDGSR